MPLSKRTRTTISISAGIGAFLVAALLIGFLSDQVARRTVTSTFPGLDTVSFDLAATSGGTRRNTDFIGRPTALFFGFTHCPEVCPATLYSLSQQISAIGPAAAPLQVVFVTVDPARDSAPVLKEYIDAINPGAIGLTGPPDEINAMLKAFGIYAEKVTLDGGDYTMDHTATVFLYDEKGRLGGTIAWGEDEQIARRKLERLLGLAG
ncbi:SCO family protein [Alphaproteobacteria bacterium LSUCC0684]